MFSILFACLTTLGDARPNVVVILADDLGFSDLGCYGGEIDTPHLDRLARSGLRFSQFYNTGRCWPTRASLMTGLYPHQAQHAMMYGSNAPAAYQGISPDQGTMISEMLHDAGYRCYHVGKWHLDSRGQPREKVWPLGRGFDRSYFMKTQNNYFNPNLLFDDEKPIRRPGQVREYYATDAFSEKAVEYLTVHHEQTPSVPFFLYLAHTAPHFPLHALPEDIDRFRERYRVGWDVIRRDRWKRLTELGIVDAPLSARDPKVPAWDSLSPEEQSMWSTRMAIHAAMVYAIDRGVGQLISLLETKSQLNNTLILFLSDNGASAEYIVRGDGHDPSAPAGSAATYLCLEVGWSNASNSPFREHKMWTHEGGIATPFIAHWPEGLKAARGGVTSTVGHVVDILPTILDCAGLPIPEVNGDDQLPGKSLLPSLRGAPPKHDRELFWEHTGNRAIRQGKWKLVSEHGRPWELYDLAEDRTETQNLADTKPKLANDLATRWQKLADEMGVVAWETLPQSKGRPSVEYRKK